MTTSEQQASGCGAKALIAVERAIAEYRRGRPVLLRGPDGNTAVALAAEMAMPAMFDRVKALGQAVLALTEARARALTIRPSGHDVILVPLTAWLDSAMARSLADATTDLNEPLRGPFDREKRHLRRRYRHQRVGR